MKNQEKGKTKKGCLISVIIIIGLIIAISALSGGEKKDPADSSTSPTNSPISTESTPSDTQEQPTTTQTPSQPDSSIPTEYKSALKSAENYSELMHMSKQGIYDQLTSEYGGKFTAEAAQYAIDNLDADYNQNALQSAKSYQENMNMSPAAIHDQLTSEYGGQFTEAEADYAIAHLE